MMKWRRVWAVARKESLHVVRDPRSLLMAVATPVFMLTLFGYALTLDVDRVPFCVWDQSATARSRELTSRFDGSRYFSLQGRFDNYNALVDAIDRGRVMMGLVIPRDFAQRLDAGREDHGLADLRRVRVDLALVDHALARALGPSAIHEYRPVEIRGIA